MTLRGGFLKGLLRRCRAQPAPPPSPPLIQRPLVLAVTPEDAVLTPTPDVLALAPEALPALGAIAEAVEARVLTGETVRAWMGGRVGGQQAPPWADGSNGALRARVTLARVAEVWHAPRFGAVIDRQGRVFRSTIQEALYLTPTLAALPHVEAAGGTAWFQPPRDLPTLPRATVFMAWGGQHNYGHFLLDCLPALAVALEAGALADYPAISPPLNAWQGQLLDLMLGEAARPRVVEAPLVRLGEALFSSCMDHFLHAPNAPLDAVRDRLLAAVDLTGGERPARIYVSRRDDAKRRLVNEAALEAALEARGFAIIRPETLSVAQQVALFHQAQVVVSATGAALANGLFCRPGAKLFELQPTNFTGMWVRNVAQLIGVDYYAFFCPSPLSETDIYLEGEHRPNIEFVWKLDLDGFLAFLDAAL